MHAKESDGWRNELEGGAIVQAIVRQGLWVALKWEEPLVAWCFSSSQDSFDVKRPAGRLSKLPSLVDAWEKWWVSGGGVGPCEGCRGGLSYFDGEKGPLGMLALVGIALGTHC